MEKFSEKWILSYKKTLSEKFLFLITSELKFYEIKSLEVTDLNFSDKKTILEYGVEVAFDYMGACDGDSYSISNMLKKISDDLHSFFSTHTIDPTNYKFKLNYSDALVSDPLFLNINYKLDQDHECLVFLRIDYVNE